MALNAAIIMFSEKNWRHQRLSLTNQKQMKVKWRSYKPIRNWVWTTVVSGAIYNSFSWNIHYTKTVTRWVMFYRIWQKWVPCHYILLLAICGSSLGYFLVLENCFCFILTVPALLSAQHTSRGRYKISSLTWCLLFNEYIQLLWIDFGVFILLDCAPGLGVTF